MNATSFVDYLVDALELASVSLIVAGACLVLGWQLLRFVERRGGCEGIEERNHSREVT